MSHIVLLLGMCQITGPSTFSPSPATDAPAMRTSPLADIDWYTRYEDAMRVAKAENKMLFLWFQAPAGGRESDRFQAVSLRSGKVRRLLRQYVAVKLPTDARITVDGERIELLKHAAFGELQGRPGVAIVDFAHRKAEQYGHVVTALPFTPGKFYRFRPEHLAVVLDLPPGTITQRTLVFAVRIHPEKPASTHGKIDRTLVQEAKSHSHYQARICNQGHHRWGQRFPRLAALLPFGLRAQEIVAESWPHETLVDAAVDVVDSWRHSSGHWSAVYHRQPRFGYDMKRGVNGIWYATGLFGNYQ